MGGRGGLKFLVVLPKCNLQQNQIEQKTPFLNAMGHASFQEAVAVLKTAKNVPHVARLVRLLRLLRLFCASHPQLDRRRPILTTMNQYLMSQFIDSTRVAGKRRLKYSLVRH